MELLRFFRNIFYDVFWFYPEVFKPLSIAAVGTAKFNPTPYQIY